MRSLLLDDSREQLSRLLASAPRTFTMVHVDLPFCTHLRWPSRLNNIHEHQRVNPSCRTAFYTQLKFPGDGHAILHLVACTTSTAVVGTFLKRLSSPPPRDLLAASAGGQASEGSVRSRGEGTAAQGSRGVLEDRPRTETVGVAAAAETTEGGDQTPGTPARLPRNYDIKVFLHHGLA